MTLTGRATKLGLSAALAATALAGAVLSWPGGASEGGALGFSESEVRAILSHGPWPPAPVRDPSNRVSGRLEAAELGESLFFDTRLSGKGHFSCASCHAPEHNWTDNLDRAVAAGQMDRNTPTLTNVRLNRWFGWDGGADSLWAQSLRPMLDTRELAASPGHVAAVVRSDAQLACRYERVFGAPPPAEDDAVLVGVAKALAAFQETLQTGRAPFDEFRDALARGDEYAAARYSAAAKRGLRIFVGKGGCTECHAGPNFTNGQFHNTGFAASAVAERADPGRQEGIKRVTESRYNLMSAYNDDPGRAGAAGTRDVKAEPRHFGEFRVPSLRNATFTAPYGHDGRFATLADMVRHYSELDTTRLNAEGGRLLKPLNLTAREQTDLVVFIESLSPYANLWRPGPGRPCP